MTEDQATKEPSLKDKLIEFCATEAKTLDEAYKAFPGYEKHSIRARFNENVGKCFKRVGKGLYLATDGKTSALLIEGDAWERIKDIDDESIDFIITDAPYSSAAKWAEMGTTRKKDTGTYGFEYHDMDSTMYAEMHRVLKEGGHMFLFFSADTEHTLDYNHNQIQTARSAGFTFNKRFIWDKLIIGMGYNGRNRYEQIFFFSKGKRHMPYDLGVPDVLAHKRISSAARKHETEKPVPLLLDIIKICGKPGDVGLDTFAGSHNFIEACQIAGCHSITIELEHKYVEEARARFGAQEVPE